MERIRKTTHQGGGWKVLGDAACLAGLATMGAIGVAAAGSGGGGWRPAGASSSVLGRAAATSASSRGRPRLSPTGDSAARRGRFAWET